MRTLLGKKAFDILKKHRIPVVEYKVVSSSEQLNGLSIPCVLKAINPNIAHKTEAGAVKVIYSREELVPTFDRMRRLGEVVYQPFVEGESVIIGIKNDATFRQTIMCGAGGIYTEVYKDVSFRVCPISNKDAEDMIKELKFYKVLSGFRGKKFNIKVLIDTLVNVSKFAMKTKIEELDINPFMINEKEGLVVDARIVL